MEFASSSSFFPESRPKWIHDVFINFRGEDTRKKFVCYLNLTLSKYSGVDTFLDEENLQAGMQLQELKRAIEVSQIAIVVFSKNYTESSWCLDELEKIIECHETYGLRVLPVFYYVAPADVRHKRGYFGKALQKTAKRKYSGADLESALSRWSYALNKATDITGWDVTKYRNEAELVKVIVNHVVNNLDYNVLSITAFPVGLESRVQEVIKYIEAANYSCIIGIWGMGGSGKTTLAKAIYNQIHYRFMHKSFIEDIRQVCQTKRGHVRVQEKFISDVLKIEVQIHSVGIGKTMIDKRIVPKKALVVFDDVNEHGQLEALCAKTLCIRKESLVIITTRDLHLLKSLQVDYVYEMKEMGEKESLELFSKHALNEVKPREDLKKLVRTALDYCGGLPLALEALGSYLGTWPKEEWTKILAKLEKIPNDQVQKKLRISFDDLCDQMVKDIFLDVCCVFIGKDRHYVTEILNGCELHADIGITVLIERSLIKVEKGNKLKIHALLRDMGREIICQGSTHELGKRRMWFQKDAIDVLTNDIGSEAIHILSLKLHSTNKDCFKADAFEKMKKLKLLQLDHVQLNGDYRYLSKQLRWIYWQGFRLNCIPNNFDLEYVIAINFKHSDLRLLWKEPKVLQCLKYLNLSHCKYFIKTPDFSNLPKLERLNLKDCSSLCKIHRSIGNLHNLKLINLKDCTSLTHLPRAVFMMKSVEILNVYGCSKLDKLEEDIIQMESLTTLIAEDTIVKQAIFSILRTKSNGYMSLCEFQGISHDVFASTIPTWMIPTINPPSYIRPICGAASFSLVSLFIRNNNLDDIAKLLKNLSNLQSVLVQYDEMTQLSNQLSTIINDANGASFTELEMTPSTSQLSMHSLRTDLIGIGAYHKVFSTLNSSIFEGLATNEDCDVLLPGDNHPHWLAHIGQEHSVYFTVPEDYRMKGMILCVAYLSTPDIMSTECLAGVFIVNYSKCKVQIHKRDTVISFKDVDWQGIISHLGPGDKVEIFVIFGDRLVVKKKTAVYLLRDESIEDREMKPYPEPKKETKKSGFQGFVKKIPIMTFGIFLFLSFHSIRTKKSIL